MQSQVDAASEPAGRNVGDDSVQSPFLTDPPALPTPVAGSPDGGVVGRTDGAVVAPKDASVVTGDAAVVVPKDPRSVVHRGRSRASWGAIAVQRPMRLAIKTLGTGELVALTPMEGLQIVWFKLPLLGRALHRRAVGGVSGVGVHRAGSV